MWLLIGRILAMLGASTVGGWIGSHIGHGSESPNFAAVGSGNGGGPLGTVPMAPGGGALQHGANDAGSTYQQGINAVGGINDQVRQSLAAIFAGNDQLRTQVQGILTDLTAKHKALIEGHPGDPAAAKTYLQFVDQKLSEVQQLLDSHKVDSQKQAQVLRDLGEQYGGVAPAGGGQQGTGGSGSGAGGSNGGAGGSSGGTGSPAGEPAGQGGLVDPLAGLGMPGGGLGAMMPGLMSGLGSIPAGLGGLGGLGGAPLDALSAFPALASLGAHGADDPSANGHGDDHAKGAEPPDDGQHGQRNAEEKPGEKAGQQGEPAAGQPAGAVTAQQQSTPAAAAPAAAATADTGRVVQMPDGTPVTAPSAQKANAIKAVLAGTGVTDSYKDADMTIPPAGTPITAPVDPSHLTPGMLAGYKSREPIPYMGNDKIWLDGQLQPKSALPAADFMAWFDPQAANPPTAAPAAVPSAPPVASN
jgi:hypothetical protein